MLDTGMLTKPGSFSNLPAGEVYLAPVEGTAEGMLVLNWAPNRKLASPIKVKVEKGRAREVSGEEPFVAEFIGNLDRFPDNRNLAELGIGTNDRASRPDNVLESEKILGTIHIAFGDNSSMGGKVSTPFHQDFVFFHPTLTVEKNGSMLKVISAGRLAV
jgi:leucyl aminopeptidase (aminopeptidase T)